MSFKTKRYAPLFLLLFAFASFGQQPDRWRGLTIDESTSEQVIEKFGKPESDKTNARLYLNNAKWLKKDIAKRLRVLHYENIEGLPDVKLGFDENSKLVLIHLEPKKLTAQAFISSYQGLEFRFGNEVMSSADLNTPRDNLEKPRQLDVTYLLVGATDKVFVFGQVGNVTGNFKSGLAEMIDPTSRQDKRQAGRSVPGDVGVIQLVSRTLENKDGSDLLK